MNKHEFEVAMCNTGYHKETVKAIIGVMNPKENEKRYDEIYESFTESWKGADEKCV